MNKNTLKQIQDKYNFYVKTLDKCLLNLKKNDYQDSWLEYYQSYYQQDLDQCREILKFSKPSEQLMIERLHNSYLKLQNEYLKKDLKTIVNYKKSLILVLDNLINLYKASNYDEFYFAQFEEMRHNLKPIISLLNTAIKLKRNHKTFTCENMTLLDFARLSKNYNRSVKIILSLHYNGIYTLYDLLAKNKKELNHWYCLWDEDIEYLEQELKDLIGNFAFN